MSEAENFYTDIAKKLTGAEQSQLFGKPCFKVGGKAFVCFFKNSMVFKLKGTLHQQALSEEGAVLFDPSGNKRPMKEWVQVPFAHADRWKGYAKAAYDYVSKG